MGSKWSRTFFSFLKVNYKQKPFEAKQVFRKIEKKIDLRRKTFWDRLFSIFRKTKSCLASKRRREAVFAYSLLLKGKKCSRLFWTRRVRPCLEHKNTFFRNFPSRLHIDFTKNPKQPYQKHKENSIKKLPKSQFFLPEKELPKVSNELFSVSGDKNSVLWLNLKKMFILAKMNIFPENS